MSSTVAVDALRVGMYIHLDGGWLSHPFPLSSFRISTPEQIATLRGLALKQVRWSPERSDPPLAAADADMTDPAGAPDAAAQAVRGADAVTPGAAPVASLRRRQLASQRESQRRCERQHAEAADAWRAASKAVADDPEAAGRSAVALARAMLSKMIDGSEMGLRLIVGGGDRDASHALNVAVVTMLIGRSMQLPDDDLVDLGVGALMHDIGKLEMAERLRHLDELTATSNEIAAWREHVGRGVEQGKRMGLGAGALAIIAQHHEHADGSGFPQRMAVDRMTIGARIVAIVDRYDKLCNPGARVAALTPHEAVATLFAGGRSKFDSAVLHAFIRVVGVYPAGSLVQLTDDRHALVVGNNSTRPLKPRVLVHDERLPRSEALLLDLETVADLGIRRSLPAARVPAQALDYLDPRPHICYAFEPLPAEQPLQALAA